jgi:signal transduction histidine kinase
MRRLTARTRLTLLYACLFAAAGVALVVVNYSLVSAGLPVPTGGAGPASDQLLPADDRPVLGSPEAISIAVNESLLGYRSEVLTRLVYQSGIALVIALMLSVVLGWIVAGRVLRPLRDMTTTARELSRGDLSLRLTVPEPDDEIRTLAETFNGMLARIEAAFGEERRIVANLSHEIRTPLANQQVAIDVTLADPDASADELRETLMIVARENRRSQVVSERILHLAQAQGTDGAHDEDVDLASVVRSAVDDVDGASLNLVADVQSASVHGDPVLLRRMVDNLLENAVKYNRPGGRIDLSVHEESGGAILVVANDGEELSAADAADLVRPFQRSRTAGSASGVGLGLAIVAAVVERHRGTLRLRPRAGGGLEVRATFPPPRPAGAG